MSRRVFISFLGTGRYQEAIYHTNIENNHFVKTRFIQEALIKEYCLNFTEKDKIIIALTEKAENINWKDSFDRDNKPTKGLEKCLKPYALDERLKVIHNLPNGESEEQMWEIFDMIYEQIEDGDEVVFDITHGFRTLPFLAIALFNFAKTTKDITLKHVLYGAYEAKNKDNSSQVWDLMPYMALNEYALGTSIFTTYGKGDYLKDFIRNHYAEIDYKHPQHRALKNLTDVSKAFSEFTDLLSINQVPQALREAKNFPLKLKNLESTEGLPYSVKPFINLLESIKNYISPLYLDDEDIFTDKGIEAQIDLMFKCVKAKDFAQAISICRELIVSYLAVKTGCDDIYDYNATRRKIETKLSTLSKVNRNNKVNLSEKQKTLAKLWDEITEIRNVINHAFMDKGKHKWRFNLVSNKVVKSCEQLKDFIITKELSNSILDLPIQFVPVLLNLSNHPSNLWQEEQLSQAIEIYSSVEDLAFPQIDPSINEEELNNLVEEYFEKIIKINPKAVHLMGEMTFVYRLVNKLKRDGITCIASTTERISEEDGNGNKISKFQFVKFRLY